MSVTNLVLALGLSVSPSLGADPLYLTEEPTQYDLSVMGNNGLYDVVDFILNIRTHLEGFAEVCDEEYPKKYMRETIGYNFRTYHYKEDKSVKIHLDDNINLKFDRFGPSFMESWNAWLQFEF